MEIRRAREILEILADGVNPITGELLPPQDSCNQVEVVRALNAVIKELERAPKVDKPQNAGKPWAEAEKNRLLDEYNSGMPIKTIAREHGRSRGAIESKLADLGMIDNPYLGRK